jgi:hypothetical protein
MEPRRFAAEHHVDHWAADSNDPACGFRRDRHVVLSIARGPWDRRHACPTPPRQNFDLVGVDRLANLDVRRRHYRGQTEGS